MERADKIGLGIASAAHVLLFGALSSQWGAPPQPIKLDTKPMEVSIADAVALQSTAPKLATEPPPPTPGEIEGPPEQAAPAPAPAPTPAKSIAPAPQPQPRPRPEPKPAAKAPPRPAPKPAPKPTPAPQPKPATKAAEKPKPQVKPQPKAQAKPAPAQPAKSTPKAATRPAAAKPAAKPAQKAGTGSATSKGTKARSSGSKLTLDTSDWMKSSSRAASSSSKPSDGAPASALGPAQKSALDAEIRRQLKPHWKAPTGADVESLRTIVNVRLSRDGSVVGTPEIVNTLGITASNRTQVKLHQEQAIKAIRLAAPFKLPANFYDSWQHLQLTFDKRLSQ